MHNRSLRFIRCDNASGNKKLQEICEKEGFGIQFEYTTPDTPQYNGQIERKFATLYARVRSILNSARVPKEMRSKLWAEATTQENMYVSETKSMSSFNKFYGK